MELEKGRVRPPEIGQAWVNSCNRMRNPRVGQHLLQLVARQAGVECFAFPFVTCAAPREPSHLAA